MENKLFLQILKIGFLLGVIVISLTNCDTKCTPGNSPSVVLFPSKWVLTKVMTSSGIQLNSSENELLSIDIGQYGYKETVSKDNKIISVKEWMNGGSDNCKESSVLVMYTDGLQRKLVIDAGSNPFRIQATGYVKQVGATDDTLKYYYESVQ